MQERKGERVWGAPSINFSLTENDIEKKKKDTTPT
jgi:hypothetical protein